MIIDDPKRQKDFQLIKHTYKMNVRQFYFKLITHFGKKCDDFDCLFEQPIRIDFQFIFKMFKSEK